MDRHSRSVDLYILLLHASYHVPGPALDLTQEEAAFDLGATHRQVFWKITLPFLRPALISSMALAFMQSFDNYNTTLFAIGVEQTLPIYIGTKLRSFISPAMNALAVVFIVLTVIGAIVYEYRRRREMIN